jgi:hypothetical protein
MLNVSQKMNIVITTGSGKENLLSRFINQKLAAYVEPTREGTPRGEIIGFSQKKYCAALMQLTATPEKELADSLQINYGTLRNWKASDPFQHQVDELCNEFASQFVDFCTEHIEAQAKAYNAWLTSAKGKKPAESIPPELSGMKFYSPKLNQVIVKHIVQKIDEVIKKDDLNGMIWIMDLGRLLGEDVALLNNDQIRRLRIGYIDFAIDKLKEKRQHFKDDEFANIHGALQLARNLTERA